MTASHPSVTLTVPLSQYINYTVYTTRLQNNTEGLENDIRLIYRTLYMSYDCIALDLRSAPTDRPVDESSSILWYIYISSRISLPHVVWVSKSKHVDKFCLAFNKELCYKSTLKCLHNKSWWQPLSKELLLPRTFLSKNNKGSVSPIKGGKIPQGYSMMDTGHPGKHSGITPGCIFPWF